MLNAVIIDDERHCIETLVWKLNEYCSSVKILGQFQKSIEAIDFIKKTPNIDILFMDIEMPNINGFEMLKFIDTHNVKIVLTTAYEKYALDALKMHVYDYLLKPIDQLELIKLVNNIEQEHNLRKLPVNAKRL
ncbi:MAG: response regulator [Saprospiraceae bacterium]|nr:response regulator [Candidatus Brachybacter algidus]